MFRQQNVIFGTLVLGTFVLFDKFYWFNGKVSKRENKRNKI